MTDTIRAQKILAILAFLAACILLSVAFNAYSSKLIRDWDAEHPCICNRGAPPCFK
jgi:hypothetical protein